MANVNISQVTEDKSQRSFRLSELLKQDVEGLHASDKKLFYIIAQLFVIFFIL